MIELRRGLSFVSYDYEGGPLRFTVPFPYLAREHVRAFVGDTDSGRMIPVTWVSDSIVETPNQDGTLTSPYVVTLRRATPIDRLLVNFNNGANLPAKDLNKALFQLLYAQQEARESGVGIPGGSNPGDYPDISEIINQVLRSPGLQEIQKRTELVDMNAETLLEDVMRSEVFYDSSREHGGMIGALAEQVTTLAVSYRPTYFGPEPPEGTDFPEGAHWVQTGPNGSYVAHIWDGTKWLFNDLSENSPTGALIQEIQRVKIDTDQAKAIASTQLQAFKDGEFATIRQEFNVVAGEHAGMYGKWQASWSVKINAGTLNGVPVVSGVSLSHNPETGSDFIVQADRFAFVHPSYTLGGELADVRFPFVIGTVGGMSTVGIQGQLVVDGSITADKITTNTLSAITANMGTVNGGTFKTHTLNARGEVTAPLEFRAEITNEGSWPIWVGQGVKNENNAVFWVDRLGNSGFDGRVNAQNIMGDFQRMTAVSWSGSIVPDQPFGKVLVQFSLQAPELVGVTHTPTAMLSVCIDHLSTDNGRCFIEVLRLDGVSWTVVDSFFVIQGIGLRINHAINFVDTPTSKEETYRVTVRDSSRGDRMAATRCNGIVLGIR